jgi:hypothetical protein
VSELKGNMMISLDGYRAGPVFLGSGTRLFHNLGADVRKPEQVEVVEAPGVTHLRYRFAS